MRTSWNGDNIARNHSKRMHGDDLQYESDISRLTVGHEMSPRSRDRYGTNSIIQKVES